MCGSPGGGRCEKVATEAKVDGTEIITYKHENVKAPVTTRPFIKDHNFNYGWVTEWMGDYAETGGWIVFILVTIIAVSATSNGANLTDGLDGLCTGTSAIIGVALAIMAYLGGNIVYASYLNIMYVPDPGELAGSRAPLSGALIRFLWYNA
mgnify:CR=1 FL=1